jgi:hypothetical protein
VKSVTDLRDFQSIQAGIYGAVNTKKQSAGQIENTGSDTLSLLKSGGPVVKEEHTEQT